MNGEIMGRILTSNFALGHDVPKYGTVDVLDGLILKPGCKFNYDAIYFLYISCKEMC